MIDWSIFSLFPFSVPGMRAGMTPRFQNFIMVPTILVPELSSSIFYACHLSVQKIRSCKGDNLTMLIAFLIVLETLG